MVPLGGASADAKEGPSAAANAAAADDAVAVVHTRKVATGRLVPPSTNSLLRSTNLWCLQE